MLSRIPNLSFQIHLPSPPTSSTENQHWVSPHNQYSPSQPRPVQIPGLEQIQWLIRNAITCVGEYIPSNNAEEMNSNFW